ncbi:DNA damage-binding protein CMR1 [Hypsizygus marmoreus]|uniref:DNA damage-binding protein CMR1 n=1 Tax=Hypsizygus marmoreus TaxID=39966 RepID=A0A369JGV2_HYPMA|nr:DNA damage-binding protein CMR1 [Hypsizygus marmoreus]
MVKLSEYELEREANIARNRALLEQLELKQAVADLGIPTASKKAAAKAKVKPVQHAKRVKKEKSELEVPRRQSSRLKRTIVDLDESPAKRQKREAEFEVQRAKEAEERLEAEERARIANQPRTHDLDLATLASEEDSQQVSALSAALQALANTHYPRRSGDPEAFVFDDHKKDKACLTELRGRLQSLKVVSRAKVTQDRIYSAAYHPEAAKDLIFFGDKHGQLGIWDARAPPDEVTDEDGELIAEDAERGKYWRLQAHWPATSKSSISSIKFDPSNAHNVYTSSYDCSVRCLSFTTGISRQIYSTGDGTLISNIDLTPNGNEMWISDGAGGATHLDLREDGAKARWYALSNQKIGCISINPTRPHFLLTASNNRTLKIWDARQLQHISSRGPHTGHVQEQFHYETVSKFLETKRGKSCLRAEWRHDKSVSSAYWDPRGRAIVSTSYDDTLRLWDIDSSTFESSDPFPSSRPLSHLNHNCQTGKWLTILRAQWSPNPDVYPHFTIGNMKHSLDIFSCKGDLVARLADPARISAVQAVTCSHPSIVERAASGNASGRCVLWSIPDAGAV